ncbi:MAG: homocysteine S-methyltransferase family protein [Pseudomonadota bacterium]
MSITLLDGGVGQELLHLSGAKPTGLWATKAMRDHPQALRAVHTGFFAAGAEIATANTYAIHRDRLDRAGQGDQFEALQRMACGIACEARDLHGSGRVAGAIGPLGWSYRPDMAPPLAEAVPLYAEVVALQAPLVDLLLIETMGSVLEARSALLAALPSGLPVWLAVTVSDDDGAQLRSGEPLRAILPLLRALRPDALLVNCSPPEAVAAALPILAQAGLPMGAYANGFVRVEPDYLDVFSSVDGLDSRTDLSPQDYARYAQDWVGCGASIIGGCCEVGPAHIQTLAQKFKAQTS